MELVHIWFPSCFCFIFECMCVYTYLSNFICKKKIIIHYIQIWLCLRNICLYLRNIHLLFRIQTWNHLYYNMYFFYFLIFAIPKQMQTAKTILKHFKKKKKTRMHHTSILTLQIPFSSQSLGQSCVKLQWCGCTMYFDCFFFVCYFDCFFVFMKSGRLLTARQQMR